MTLARHPSPPDRPARGRRPGWPAFAPLGAVVVAIVAGAGMQVFDSPTGREPGGRPAGVAASSPVVHDGVGGSEIVVFFTRVTASALDADEIARGRDAGAAGVFVPVVDGSAAHLAAVEGAFVDEATGGRWNLLGEAVAGPLAGQRLEAVPHIDTFWFAAAAFRPGTVIWEGPGADGR